MGINLSRKSFIITALLINLTICLTLCVVQFTDKDKSEKADTQTTLSEMKGQVTDEPQSDYLNSDEESSDENGINKDSTLEDTTSSHQTTETTKNTAANDTTTVAQTTQQTTQQATTEAPKEEESTTKLDLSQVFNPTGETTAFANETVSGTTAVIISSCNIRSSADVAGNIIGTANIGSTYQIDASKCSSNWVAIYLEDATIGYISTSYCSVQ